jgi:predicted DNA-binding protein
MKNQRHINTREHKDITCAVRLPQSLYNSLSEAAKLSNSSLSDIMREAIIEKIDSINSIEIDKRLKKEGIRAQIEKLGSGSGENRNEQIDALLGLLDAS